MQDFRYLGISLAAPTEDQSAKMFAKLFFIFALVVVAWGVEYPPGVHPAVCPNYPYCNVRALATHTLDGTPIPEWILNPNLLPEGPQNINAVAATHGFRTVYRMI